MYIVFLLFTLISSTAFCETTWLEDGPLLEDFIVVNKGHMGYPTILMYIEQLAISVCADTCRRHLRCVTFNYNWNTRACELVDRNFDEFEAEVDEPGWHNYGAPSRIDGGWSNWFESSPCSATCGNGLQTQYRTCTVPEPKYGGDPCIGNEVQTVSCKIVPCPNCGLVLKLNCLPSISPVVHASINGELSNQIDDDDEFEMRMKFASVNFEKTINEIDCFIS